MKTSFGLIGDGYIAKYHKEAIKHVGGELVAIHDPKYPKSVSSIEGVPRFHELGEAFFGPLEVVVICSPSDLHREHTMKVLDRAPWATIIVEKPACLPWEPLVEADNINVVLQLRYLPNLPEKAKRVSVTMVRDEAYFESWKGDAKLTGGVFYNLFVHYLDLASRLGADFTGLVTREGKQERRIDDMDILNIDMQKAYNAMYDDIMNGGGIKPREMFYLNWLMNRYSNKNGYGRSIINVPVYIENQLT